MVTKNEDDNVIVGQGAASYSDTINTNSNVISMQRIFYKYFEYLKP